MRPHRLVPILCASLAIAACGRAEAAGPDSARDVDCSVLAFYFARAAERSGAPADQRHGAQALHLWYSERIQAIALRQGNGNGVLAEAAPVLAAVNADPRAMLDEYSACAERAFADRGWDAFAEREAQSH